MEGDFRIDGWLVQPDSNAIVFTDGIVPHLEPRVMEVLKFLTAEKPGDGMSRRRLLREARAAAADSRRPLDLAGRTTSRVQCGRRRRIAGAPSTARIRDGTARAGEAGPAHVFRPGAALVARRERALLPRWVGATLAVDVIREPALFLGRPTMLLAAGGKYEQRYQSRAFDVTRDGKLFLMTVRLQPAPSRATRVNILLDWRDRLRAQE